MSLYKYLLANLIADYKISCRPTQFTTIFMVPSTTAFSITVNNLTERSIPTTGRKMLTEHIVFFHR